VIAAVICVQYYVHVTPLFTPATMQHELEFELPY